MTYGPCGGTTPSGGCEVGGQRCAFLEGADIRFVRPSGRRPKRAAGRGVWVDFRPEPAVPEATSAAAAAIADAGAGVLIGDHLDEPPPRVPHRNAALVLGEQRLRAVVTLTCRDRDESQLRAEIDELVRQGAHAVHCVTGDHPRSRLGWNADPAFDLDGTQLAALAHRVGAVVSVAESPASPPTALRPRRLRSKQDAGADVAFLNHAGSPAELVAFARHARDEGVELGLVAPVPVVTDAGSAAALRDFPGLRLPDGLIDAVLSSADPRRRGVEEARRIGTELAASGAFVGLNLSGPGRARGAGVVERAELMAGLAGELLP